MSCLSRQRTVVTLAELDVAPWLVRALAFVFGSVWGSFVNVVIYRVPRDLSVAYPGSRCPACDAPIRPWDNLPILTFLALRGRARCCGARISPRYLVVEALGGLIAVALVDTAVLTLPGATPLARAGAIFLGDFGVAMALVAAAFIDAEHMILPDAITLGGTVFGLATPALRGLGWSDALLGAAAGFLGVWLPFVVGYRRLRGRDGMGLGDAKLVMMAGALYGWRGAAFALFVGALQATVAALILFLVEGKIEEPAAVRIEREEIVRAAQAGDVEAERVLREDPLATEPTAGLMSARLPFGPFLCLAILEWMLAGEWLREHLGLG
jgi:leader peptidase (prepilin peptidase)/N-methyltransferase